MPDLAALRSNSARLTVDYGGATFAVDYRFADVGPRTHETQRKMQAGDMEALYAELAHLVAAWDATDAGVPVPTTADGFRSAGVGVCIALWNAILPDVGNPTVAPSGAVTHSSSGSSPTADSAPAPTTTPSFATPNGSGSHPGSWPASAGPPATPVGSSGAIG